MMCACKKHCWPHILYCKLQKFLTNSSSLKQSSPWSLRHFLHHLIQVQVLKFPFHGHHLLVNTSFYINEEIKVWRVFKAVTCWCLSLQWAGQESWRPGPQLLRETFTTHHWPSVSVLTHSITSVLSALTKGLSSHQVKVNTICFHTWHKTIIPAFLGIVSCCTHWHVLSITGLTWGGRTNVTVYESPGVTVFLGHHPIEQLFCF